MRPFIIGTGGVDNSESGCYVAGYCVERTGGPGLSKKVVSGTVEPSSGGACFRFTSNASSSPH